MSIVLTGRNNTPVEVNDEHQLVVRAINESEIEHASGKLGSAYSWTSAATDIVAGEKRLFVKNLSNTPLVLDRLRINGSNVICQWDIHIGGATTTPAGTLITGVNLNQQFSGNVADAIAYDDETAVATGSQIDEVWTPITTTVTLDMRGVILGKNHYIQIIQVTESTSGSAVLFGHFEVVS